MKNELSISRIVLISIILFAFSEVIHKIFLYTENIITFANIFVIIARSLIYVWASIKLASKISFSKFLIFIFGLSLYEYFILGTISLMILSFLEGEFLIVKGLIGITIVYPVALVMALIISCLTFSITKKLESKAK